MRKISKEDWKIWAGIGLAIVAAVIGLVSTQTSLFQGFALQEQAVIINTDPNAVRRAPVLTIESPQLTNTASYEISVRVDRTVDELPFASSQDSLRFAYFSASNEIPDNLDIETVCEQDAGFVEMVKGENLQYVSGENLQLEEGTNKFIFCHRSLLGQEGQQVPQNFGPYTFPVIYYSVDNEAPELEITSPAESDGLEYTLEGTATDNRGIVALYYAFPDDFEDEEALQNLALDPETFGERNLLPFEQSGAETVEFSREITLKPRSVNTLIVVVADRQGNRNPIPFDIETTFDPDEVDGDDDDDNQDGDDDDDDNDDELTLELELAELEELYAELIEEGLEGLSGFESLQDAIEAYGEKLEELPEGVRKAQLYRRYNPLEADIESLNEILIHLEAFAVNPLESELEPEIVVAELKGDEAYLENKIAAADEDEEPTELWDELVELIEELLPNWEQYVLPEGDLVTVDFAKSAPNNPVIETMLDSDRVVVNLYRAGTEDAVYTVDYNLETVLEAGKYNCILGVGCPGWNGEIAPLKLPPGRYMYVASIKVLGQTFRGISEPFTLDLKPAPGVSGPHADVPPNDPRFRAIGYVYELGIMRGSTATGQSLFRPNDPVLRTETVAIVNRLAGLNRACVPYNPAIDGNIGFVDLSQYVTRPDSYWFMNEIKCSRLAGIVRGYPDATMRPLTAIKWGEAAKLMIEGTRAGGVLNGLFPAANPNANPWWLDYYGFLGRNGVALADGSQTITRGDLAALVYQMGQAGLLLEDMIAANTGA